MLPIKYDCSLVQLVYPIPMSFTLLETGPLTILNLHNLRLEVIQ